MCMYGTYKAIKTDICFRPVDACIANEINFLRDIGVITYGCCCGHGNGEYLPVCLISGDSVAQCEQLGYEVRERPESDCFEIDLKSGCKTKEEIKEWHKKHASDLFFDSIDQMNEFMEKHGGNFVPYNERK